MRSGRWNAWLLAGALVLAGCGTEVVVTATHSDQLGGVATPADPVSTDPPASDPADTEPPATEPPATDPIDTEPPETEPAGTAPPPSTDAPVSVPRQDPDRSAIDFGADKPGREHDALLLATATDLEEWWTEQYPLVYGEEFTPLQGQIYAAYPSRPGQLPGCGTPQTTYQEVSEFVAFYCGDGDFIIYDDGPDSLLTRLAQSFGPSTIGIVLAHEYGHAVQQRIGALDQRLDTITTEQQADCVAGAWAARAFRGESPYVRFSDDDVRSGLIAMLEVRDPVGFDQTEAGGHGSGFDRVNAFQVGFLEGPRRCAELIDDPLPLVPNQFRTLEDQQSLGNAPLTFGDDGLLTFLPEDLNLYWDVELDAEIPGFDGLTVEANNELSEVACDDLTGNFDDGAALCSATDTVHLNLPVATELHAQSQTFGDYSVGYLLGYVWAEAVQMAVGSGLAGVERQLMNDCLTGAWSNSVTPGSTGLPEPRAEGREASISPGDLDEAIRLLIRVGDSGADDDDLGTPFEKIDAFRTGVLGGLDACNL